MFHLYFLLSSYQCQHSKCLLLVFCFAVINSCVYFVRRGFHISWYNLLSNPIVYVQYNIIKLKLLVSFAKRITTIRVVSSSDAVYRTDKT
jgi:hypothetical protein